MELDTEGTGFSPGVRRMIAVVGSDSSFQHGREQLEVLAGLEVTTKTVERQALQLDLPIIIDPAVEVMYMASAPTGICSENWHPTRSAAADYWRPVEAREFALRVRRFYDIPLCSPAVST